MKPSIVILLSFNTLAALSNKPDSFLIEDRFSRIYGFISPTVNSKGKFGAGFAVGYRFAKEVGMGIGAEAYKIDTFDNASVAAPILGEVRFFIPTRSIEPFIALQGGYMIWNYQSTIRIGNASTKVDLKGKGMYGGNVGFKVPVSPKLNVFFGAAYRNYVVATGTEKNVRIFTSPTTSHYEKQWEYNNSHDSYWVFSLGIAW